VFKFTSLSFFSFTLETGNFRIQHVVSKAHSNTYFFSKMYPQTHGRPVSKLITIFEELESSSLSTSTNSLNSRSSTKQEPTPPVAAVDVTPVPVVVPGDDVFADDCSNTVVSSFDSLNYQVSRSEERSFDYNLGPDETNLPVESYYRDHPAEKVRAAQQYLHLYPEPIVFEFIPAGQQYLYSYPDYADVNIRPPNSIPEHSSPAEPYQYQTISTCPAHLPTIPEEEIDEIEHLVEAMSLDHQSTNSADPRSLSPSLYSIPSDYSALSPTPLSPPPQHITAPAFATLEPYSPIAATHIPHPYIFTSFIPIYPTDLPPYLTPSLSFERAELADIIVRPDSTLDVPVQSTWRPRNVCRERKMKARKELEEQGRGIGGVLRRMKKRIMWLGVYEGKRLRKRREGEECVGLCSGCSGEQISDTHGEGMLE
jgi:hypothetical protein